MTGGDNCFVSNGVLCQSVHALQLRLDRWAVALRFDLVETNRIHLEHDNDCIRINESRYGPHC